MPCQHWRWTRPAGSRRPSVAEAGVHWYRWEPVWHIFDHDEEGGGAVARCGKKVPEWGVQFTAGNAHYAETDGPSDFFHGFPEIDREWCRKCWVANRSANAEPSGLTE